jgi:UDP-N-acetylglucosamine transferase subunit ALG13
MIYVTVGGHSQPFDRLIKKVDEIASKNEFEFVVQYGCSKYIPKNCKGFDYIPFKKAEEYIKTADLVISHAGVGTILLAKKYNTPIILVPRRRKYKEHYTDHQVEICKIVQEQKRENIYVVQHLEYLEQEIRKVLSLPKNNKSLTENMGAAKIAQEIEKFIEHFVIKT